MPSKGKKRGRGKGKGKGKGKGSAAKTASSGGGGGGKVGTQEGGIGNSSSADAGALGASHTAGGAGGAGGSILSSKRADDTGFGSIVGSGLTVKKGASVIGSGGLFGSGSLTAALEEDVFGDVLGDCDDPFEGLLGAGSSSGKGAAAPARQSAVAESATPAVGTDAAAGDVDAALGSVDSMTYELSLLKRADSALLASVMPWTAFSFSTAYSVPLDYGEIVQNLSRGMGTKQHTEHFLHFFHKHEEAVGLFKDVMSRGPPGWHEAAKNFTAYFVVMSLNNHFLFDGRDVDIGPLHIMQRVRGVYNVAYERGGRVVRTETFGSVRDARIKVWFTPMVEVLHGTRSSDAAEALEARKLLALLRRFEPTSSMVLRVRFSGGSSISFVATIDDDIRRALHLEYVHDVGALLRKGGWQAIRKHQACQKDSTVIADASMTYGGEAGNVVRKGSLLSGHEHEGARSHGDGGSGGVEREQISTTDVAFLRKMAALLARSSATSHLGIRKELSMFALSNALDIVTRLPSTTEPGSLRPLLSKLFRQIADLRCIISVLDVIARHAPADSAPAWTTAVVAGSESSRKLFIPTLLCIRECLEAGYSPDDAQARKITLAGLDDMGLLSQDVPMEVAKEAAPPVGVPIVLIASDEEARGEGGDPESPPCGPRYSTIGSIFKPQARHRAPGVSNVEIFRDIEGLFGDEIRCIAIRHAYLGDLVDSSHYLPVDQWAAILAVSRHAWLTNRGITGIDAVSDEPDDVSRCIPKPLTRQHMFSFDPVENLTPEVATTRAILRLAGYPLTPYNLQGSAAVDLPPRPVGPLAGGLAVPGEAQAAAQWRPTEGSEAASKPKLPVDGGDHNPPPLPLPVVPPSSSVRQRGGETVPHSGALSASAAPRPPPTDAGRAASEEHAEAPSAAADEK